MINMYRKTVSITLFLAMVIGLSACSGLTKIKGALGNDGTANYQNNQSIKELEIPPDLTKPEFDKSFELPAGIVSAVSLKNKTAVPQQDVTNTAEANTSTIRKGDLSSIITIAGKTVLKVNDTYPRSLILTEIMLTRMNFSTVSKSSAGDVITARYDGSDVTVDGQRKGLFNKLKSLVSGGGDNKALVSGKSYRVTIKNEQGSATVSIAPTAGILSNAAHTKIITLLNSTFNS